MSRFSIVAVMCACLAVMSPQASRAALDFAVPAIAHSDLEIIVVEAPGCTYCNLFRRDVWPFYESSLRAKSVPMRFADVNSDAVEELSLAGPIDSVPTALVLRQNIEVGRIPGYVGREGFFHSIDRLLAGTP